MKITITDSFIGNSQVAFNLPAGADIEIVTSGTIFSNVGEIVRLRDAPSFLERVGLRSDTPPELVRELLLAARAAEAPDPSSLVGRIEPYISSAAGVVAVGQAIWTWAHSPQFESLLGMFS